MERNGLDDRRREVKIGKWVLGISGFLFVSFFLAPLTLEPGTQKTGLVHIGIWSNPTTRMVTIHMGIKAMFGAK